MLAQLVEHWTFNPSVLGSSPRRPTIQREKMSNYDYRPELEEQEEGEKQLKEKIKKLPEEEENDSDRNDREAPPC
tara:strand:- start:2136 stop:2360 length:225 start_codon:yes stop_codon:yes gene_type:complete